MQINGIKLKFHDSAEHVGVIRAVSGNLPNIVNRISSQKKAVGAVLHNGLAKHHRADPASRLKVEEIYGTPVLLSGLGSLVLKKTEQNLINHHRLETLRSMLRLLPSTPHPVIYFLAGCLPGEALIHLKQLALLGMISRLPESLLHRQALNVFSSKGTSTNLTIFIF